MKTMDYIREECNNLKKCNDEELNTKLINKVGMLSEMSSSDFDIVIELCALAIETDKRIIKTN
jgi:endonuclease V-like protein UPF0215 family|tara:strand:+ start:203 stop:391 length:189 start_codon:yes stop_codon:yes gene_type:complete